MKRTRIRPMSAKRQREAKEYSKLRTAYLATHPTCERCQRLKSRDIHHKAGRLAGNYLNPATWAALCRPCHDHIHAHPSQARASGWMT
jgi:hypothetical protein